MLPPEWIIRDKIPDYGIDWEIQIVSNGEVTNKVLWAQLKATERLILPNNVPLKVESDHLKFFETCHLPVVVLYWVKSLESCFCMFVQGFIWDNLNQENPEWKEQKSVTIHFPPDSELNLEKLKTIAVDGYLKIVQNEMKRGLSGKEAFYWLDGIPKSDNRQLKEMVYDTLKFLQEEHFIEAIEAFSHILRVCTVSPTEKMSILNNMGTAYYFLCNYTEALKYFNAAIEVSEKTNEEDKKEGLLVAHSNIGLVYSMTGYPDLALLELKPLIKTYQDSEYKLIEGILLNSIGLAYQDKGMLNESLKYLKDAATSFRNANYVSGVATSLNNIGLIYIFIKNYDYAEDLFTQALNIYEGIDFTLGIANAVGNLGMIYNHKNNYDKALEYLNRALRIHRELKTRKYEANELGSIGLVYLGKGDFPLAYDYLNQALQVHREIGDRNGIAHNLNNLGYLQMKEWNPSGAIDYYLQAIKIYQESGNKLAEINTLNNLKDAYIFQDKFDKAKQCYDKIIKLSAELGMNEI